MDARAARVPSEVEARRAGAERPQASVVAAGARTSAAGGVTRAKAEGRRPEPRACRARAEARRAEAERPQASVVAAGARTSAAGGVTRAKARAGGPSRARAERERRPGGPKPSVRPQRLF